MGHCGRVFEGNSHSRFWLSCPLTKVLLMFLQSLIKQPALAWLPRHAEFKSLWNHQPKCKNNTIVSRLDVKKSRLGHKLCLGWVLEPTTLPWRNKCCAGLKCLPGAGRHVESTGIESLCFPDTFTGWWLIPSLESTSSWWQNRTLQNVLLTLQSEKCLQGAGDRTPWDCTGDTGKASDLSSGSAFCCAVFNSHYWSPQAFNKGTVQETRSRPTKHLNRNNLRQIKYLKINN